MSKKIEFVIKKDGKVELDVQGACGEECKDLTAPFEDALGVVDSVDVKPAYYDELDNLEQKVGEDY